MLKAYAEGVQGALIKLGFTLIPGTLEKWLHEDPDYRQRVQGHLNKNPDLFRAMDAAAWEHMHAAQERNRQKMGSTSVLVTKEQTPQVDAEPMADGALQQRSVEHLWDEHDKRQQLFTSQDPD